ncbi:MAG: hypothetical protein HY000_06270 [Planctomycetes bacterium]|nr:hypothetical protein [Planctomycetota bacterium]
MRHFIAYHNNQKMGRALHEGQPLRVLTNKTVDHLLQNTVWFVTREGSQAREYSLGSVFRVAETGDVTEGHFQRFATGTGHVFMPPAPIHEMEWFPDLLRSTGNFAFGVTEIKNDAVIAGLMWLASQAGYEVN